MNGLSADERAHVLHLLCEGMSIRAITRLTGEARAAYEADTTDCLRNADGALFRFFTPDGAWDTRFSKLLDKPEPWDLTRRERYVPLGYTQVTVPTSEVKDFGKWAAEFYGGESLGEGKTTQIIKRTNPDAKWDWWRVGGRWGNMVPGNTCMVEAIPQFFTDWTPSVLIDANGWHASKEWGWFGSSNPSETPQAPMAKMAEHAGKRVWVVDFHI